TGPLRLHAPASVHCPCAPQPKAGAHSGIPPARSCSPPHRSTLRQRGRRALPRATGRSQSGGRARRRFSLRISPLALALTLLAAPGHATPEAIFPGLIDVTGVAADDVLN